MVVSGAYRDHARSLFVHSAFVDIGVVNGARSVFVGADYMLRNCFSEGAVREAVHVGQFVGGGFFVFVSRFCVASGATLVIGFFFSFLSETFVNG